jgi:hypothetical protein
MIWWISLIISLAPLLIELIRYLFLKFRKIKMIGYVRQLDLDGTLRIRESDYSHSPTLFAGNFKSDHLEILKEAFKNSLPIEFSAENGCLVSARIFKHPRIY